jgi:exonuclease III
MRIVSWNMNRLARSAADHEKAWSYLEEKLAADLALVQEAQPPDRFSTHAYRPIDRSRYNWGSAVVALKRGLGLRERVRVPLANCYLDALAEGELPDSHPGASAVADVSDKDGHPLFTAASVYGQWEMRPGGKDMDACPRLHRIISDLTGVLVGARRHPVLLAGDLNVTTQYPTDKPSQRDTDAAAAATAVFARLGAFGLQDCRRHGAASANRPASCRCLDGDLCRHTRTFRSGNVEESAPTQLDYLFASDSLLTAATGCHVDDSAEAWALSDHCPVVIDIDEQALRGTSRRAG